MNYFRHHPSTRGNKRNDEGKIPSHIHTKKINPTSLGDMKGKWLNI
jgi:hypothetical protein